MALTLIEKHPQILGLPVGNNQMQLGYLQAKGDMDN